jgi:hypothetical protein
MGVILPYNAEISKLFPKWYEIPEKRGKYVNFSTIWAPALNLTFE